MNRYLITHNVCGVAEEDIIEVDKPLEEVVEFFSDDRDSFFILRTVKGEEKAIIGENIISISKNANGNRVEKGVAELEESAKPLNIEKVISAIETILIEELKAILAETKYLLRPRGDATMKPKGHLLFGNSPVKDDDLLKLVQPLMKFLKSNCDPYCKIEVSSDRVKVIRTEEQYIVYPQSCEFTPEDSDRKYSNSPACECPR